MRSLVVWGFALGLVTTPAMACNSEILSVADWHIIEDAQSRLMPVRIEATVQYNGPKPYRMIHAGVMFADALGQSLGQVNLNRDQNVSPADVVSAKGFVSASERLPKIDREDVVHRTCVWSIVYDDGTVDRFD